jgi:hypothetical protein
MVFPKMVGKAAGANRNEAFIVIVLRYRTGAYEARP